jgi:hypothetical protein
MATPYFDHNARLNLDIPADSRYFDSTIVVTLACRMPRMNVNVSECPKIARELLVHLTAWDGMRFEEVA